ncbi:MAG: efflux RND transporter permease subunit, partial [Bacteroidales bacterium]|nr:efflux RND transporter permease subunit [Bacteroidales bacterium]
LTLTPLLSSKILKKYDVHKKIVIKKTDFLRRIVDGPYRKTLRIVLSRRWLTIGAAVGLFVFSMYIFGFVGVSFFPKAEKPQLMIEANLPDGINIDKTDRVMQQIEAVLDTMNIVEYYAANIGHGNPRIYYNVFSHNYSSNYGDIFLRTRYYDAKTFDALVDSLRSYFKDITGAEIAVKEFEQGPDANAPIMIYIKGDDLEVLGRISGEFEAQLRKQPGAINIENNLSKKRTDLYFNINKEKASMYGVPIYEIDKTIRTAVNGMVVSKYRDKEGKEYDIEMRMPVGQEFTVADFDKVYVKSLSGKIIPLNQLARLEFKKEPGQISRFDLQRSVILSGYVGKGAVIDNIMAPIIKELEAYNWPAGYSYHIGGELENRQESFGGMQIAVIIALISIFAVLVLQFKSFVQPLIIFAAIPLAIIGSIWALLITGNTFSFTSFIGLTSLIGIVINNSIILVDFTNQLRKEGKSMQEALQVAGETRFVPIILTTLTTIGGLLPLTLQGGTMWAPMGWTIIGGLLVSTFLTLLVVPVMYSLFVKDNNIELVENAS